MNVDIEWNGPGSIMPLTSKSHIPAQLLVELMICLLPTLHSFKESVSCVRSHDVPNRMFAGIFGNYPAEQHSVSPKERIRKYDFQNDLRTVNHFREVYIDQPTYFKWQKINHKLSFISGWLVGFGKS